MSQFIYKFQNNTSNAELKSLISKNPQKNYRFDSSLNLTNSKLPVRIRSNSFRNLTQVGNTQKSNTNNNITVSQRKPTGKITYKFTKKLNEDSTKNDSTNVIFNSTRPIKRLNKNNSSCSVHDRHLINLKQKSNNVTESKDHHSFSNVKSTLKSQNTEFKSIFKIFQQKIHNLRNNYHLDCKKNVSNNNCNIDFDNSKELVSKNIFEKLLRECKKLNGNIIKLYSDTTKLNCRIRDINSLGDNFTDKTRNFKQLRRSNSMVLDHLSKPLFQDDFSLNKFEEINFSDILTAKNSCFQSKLNRDYYHLACALYSDQDYLNLTTSKQTKAFDLERDESNQDKQQNAEEITNISTFKPLENNEKRNLISFDETEQEKMSDGKSKITNHNEMEADDTLCDLDYEDEMNTESIVIPNEKSPIKCGNKKSSESHYETANIELVKQPNNLKSKSTSVEMPPIPSDPLVNSSGMISLTNIEPPCDTNKFKFISRYETDFRPQLILYHVSDNIFDTSKYTSSITINCSKPKPLKRISNANKPPISRINSLWKNDQFLKLNSNNNSIDEYDNNLEDIFQKSEYSYDNTWKCFNRNQNNNDEKVGLTTSKLPGKNYLAMPNDDREEQKRIAPLKNLMQHSRVSEQMNEIILNQQKEERLSPTANTYIERQRQQKIARQKEQHQKAKEMAVEAAKMRKERQAELQAYDSHDSSRIMSKLFADPEENDVPAYSLFDAVHYNFRRRRVRKPNLDKLMESKIKGILPEADSDSPEPEKGPITTEEFRNQPMSFQKTNVTAKRYNEEELAKYEPINVYKPPPIVKKEEPVKKEVVDSSNVKKVEEKTLVRSNSMESFSQKSDFTESFSNSLNTISFTSSSSSVSSSSTESSESESSSSSESTPVKKRKSKHKDVKKNKNKKPKNEEKKKKKKKLSTDSDESDEDETESEKQSKSLVKKLVQYKEKKSMVESLASDFNQEDRFKGTKFNDIIKKPNKLSIISTKSDEALTENFQDSITQTTRNFFDYDSDDDFNIQELTQSIPKISQYTTEKLFGDQLVKREVPPLKLSLPPNPNTSLSGFVNEIIIQLRSLNDTVDILLNRMDAMETNLLDCTKYFVV